MIQAKIDQQREFELEKMKAKLRQELQELKRDADIACRSRIQSQNELEILMGQLKIKQREEQDTLARLELAFIKTAQYQPYSSPRNLDG